MTPREIEEYRALRATIRERGTARIWIFLAGLAAWSATTIATAALAAPPLATLLPLLLLAAGFEAIINLHTGVERIGRYLQVFFEQDEPAGSPVNERRESSRVTRAWEQVAMAYGRAYPGGSDPIFAAHFALATMLNFLPVLLAEPVPVEVVVIGAVHILFIVRVAVARHYAGRQRTTDLERFQRIKQGAWPVDQEETTFARGRS